ncbi:hypothetical protein Tco_0515820 [Tanacetum coccineum]
MKLNFEGQPMQLLAAMLPQDQEGEGAGVAAQLLPTGGDFAPAHSTSPSRDPFKGKGVTPLKWVVAEYGLGNVTS